MVTILREYLSESYGCEISRGPDLYQEYLTKNISTKTISPGDPPNQEYFHQEYLTKNISTKNISLSHLVTHQEYLQMKSADSRRGNSCSIIEITSAFRKDFIDLKFKLKSHLSLEKWVLELDFWILPHCVCSSSQILSTKSSALRT